jgi:hypothetical protein
MKIYSLLLSLLIFTTVSSWAGSSGLLDGKTFKGTVTEEGKKKGDNDTITFNGGQFLSEECAPYGFAKASYSATMETEGIKFHAEVVSSKHKDEKLVWDGAVKGRALTGKMVWMKKEKHTNYTIEAVAK